MTEPPQYIVTERLLLRPWEGTDMYDLYEQAKDPEIGPASGWPVHTSPEHSLRIIQEILRKNGSYAIVPKAVRRPVGAIDLKFGKDGNICLGDDEAEIGYWIGKGYWGNGFVPEAAKALLRCAFTELDLKRVWCICRTDNTNSMRVQEKCGFSYIRNGTINDPIYGTLEMRFTCITKEEWVKSQ